LRRNRESARFQCAFSRASVAGVVPSRRASCSRCRQRYAAGENFPVLASLWTIAINFAIIAIARAADQGIPMQIEYRDNAFVSIDAAIELYSQSTLAERRPVDRPDIFEGMLRNADYPRRGFEHYPRAWMLKGSC
jgi:hypothetical protein